MSQATKKEDDRRRKGWERMAQEEKDRFATDVAIGIMQKAGVGIWPIDGQVIPSKRKKITLVRKIMVGIGAFIAVLGWWWVFVFVLSYGD
jgi:hypothetical protein